MGRPIFLPPTLNSEKTINSGFFFYLSPALQLEMLLQTFPSGWEVWELQHHDKCHGTGADWAGGGVAPQPPWGVQLSLDPSSQSSGPRADPEQSWDSAQEPPLPPQLMGLSHVLVRKSSPNLSVKGVHCQQVAWTLCHFVTSHVTDAESPFQPLCFQALF